MNVKHHLAERDETAKLGFWIYILTDVMLFGALFATYMILRHNTAGGPNTVDIVQPPYVLIQTILLLASTFTVALAVLAAKHGRMPMLKAQLALTAVLGLGFLLMEINEFVTLVAEGHTWHVSAFLSAFFALVGTHGAHILTGLIWLGVLWWLIDKRGLTPHTERKLGLFALFWHFLDIVWIFIFAVVYMFGVGVV